MITRQHDKSALAVKYHFFFSLSNWTGNDTTKLCKYSHNTIEEEIFQPKKKYNEWIFIFVVTLSLRVSFWVSRWIGLGGRQEEDEDDDEVTDLQKWKV